MAGGQHLGGAWTGQQGEPAPLWPVGFSQTPSGSEARRPSLCYPGPLPAHPALAYWPWALPLAQGADTGDIPPLRQTDGRRPSRHLSSQQQPRRLACRQTDRQTGKPQHRLPCECPPCPLDGPDRAYGRPCPSPPSPALGLSCWRGKQPVLPEGPSARLRLVSKCFFIGKIWGEKLRGAL